MSAGEVSFRWKDYRDAAREKLMTLSADEFIRRFLLHVLPAGFVRLRHYGVLANGRRKQRLQQWRDLLQSAPPAHDRVAQAELPETKEQTERCPCCGQGRLRRLFELGRRARPPVARKAANVLAWAA